MNDLTIRPATALWTVTTASTPCSADLWRRLKGRDLPFFEDVAELAKSAHAVAELRQALPVLEEALRPATKVEIAQEVVALKVLFGLGAKRTEAEWKSIGERFMETLKAVPLAALKAGIQDYIAQPAAEHFPMPGPLKALCEPHYAPVLHALAKARRVVADADRERDRLASLPSAPPARPGLVRELTAEVGASVFHGPMLRRERIARREEKPFDVAPHLSRPNPPRAPAPGRVTPQAEAAQASASMPGGATVTADTPR